MIIPRELPDLKLKIARQFHESPSFDGVFEWVGRRNTRPFTRAWLAEVFSLAIISSPVHYVTEEFGQLAAFAAHSLDQIYFEESTLPSPSGLLYSAKKVPVSVMVRRDGAKEIRVERGIEHTVYYWEVNQKHQTLDVLQFIYSVPEGMWSVAELLNVHLGRTQDFSDVITEAEGGNIVPEFIETPFSMKYFFSLILLMNQELHTVEREYPSRATIRRLNRQGAADDPGIRVIYLRKPRGSTASDGHGPLHNQSHRWMVRGHWHKYRCGPGRSQVRPVWISPFVKGPPDKPLWTGEKVYNWGR